jgi:hypothetical protein
MRPTTHLPPVGRFFAIRVFPGAVVLVGAAAIYLGLANARVARASVDWPAVDGEIVRSGIQEERITTRSGPPSLTHRAVVVYTYSAGGVRYEGNRVAFGEYATSDPEDAAQIVNRYPTGTAVRVHYRPDDPAVSVLEPGDQGRPWLYTALGLVFALVGAVLAFVTPKLVGRRIQAPALSR